MGFEFIEFASPTPGTLEPSSFMGSSVSDGLGLRERKSIFLYA
jgi:hypothetical protein